MKQTKKVALAGVFSALCLVFLFIGALFQTLDLSAAAFASIIVLVAMTELGKGWALGVYAAASILSLLLLPYKSAALVFAMFAGFYPILKAPLNKIKPKWFSYLARLACFNLLLSALIFVATRLIGVEEEYLAFGFVIYALANLTFVVYDFALERIALSYITRIKPKLFGKQ